MIYGQEIASQGFWSVKVKVDRTSSMNTTAQVHRSLFLPFALTSKKDLAALCVEKRQEKQRLQGGQATRKKAYGHVFVCVMQQHIQSWDNTGLSLIGGLH